MGFELIYDIKNLKYSVENRNFLEHDPDLAWKLSQEGGKLLRKK